MALKETVLWASLAFNAFAILELTCTTDFISDCSLAPPDSMTVDCPCSSDDSHRYTDEVDGGGAPITRDVAQDKLNKFHTTYSECTMSGAFISKKALDELFCANDTWNGIYCLRRETRRRP